MSRRFGEPRSLKADTVSDARQCQHASAQLKGKGEQAMGNRYERSRMSRSFTHKGIQYHPGVLLVLASQLLCLSAFAFASDSVGHDKWLSVPIAFSLLFGLILSLGFFGTWSQFRDDIDLWTFLNTNPVESAVAIAAAGEALAILMGPPA
jgi:hypothetical protein